MKYEGSETAGAVNPEASLLSSFILHNSGAVGAELVKNRRCAQASPSRGIWIAAHSGNPHGASREHCVIYCLGWCRR